MCNVDCTALHTYCLYCDIQQLSGYCKKVWSVYWRSCKIWWPQTGMTSCGASWWNTSAAKCTAVLSQHVVKWVGDVVQDILWVGQLRPLLTPLSGRPAPPQQPHWASISVHWLHQEVMFPLLIAGLCKNTEPWWNDGIWIKVEPINFLEWSWCIFGTFLCVSPNSQAECIISTKPIWLNLLYNK